MKKRLFALLLTVALLLCVTPIISSAGSGITISKADGSAAVQNEDYNVAQNGASYGLLSSDLTISGKDTSIRWTVVNSNITNLTFSNATLNSMSFGWAGSTRTINLIGNNVFDSTGSSSIVTFDVSDNSNMKIILNGLGTLYITAPVGKTPIKIGNGGSIDYTKFYISGSVEYNASIDELSSSVVLSDGIFEINDTPCQTVYFNPKATVADVLATNTDFPTSDSWENVPDDAWENENGSTAHLATNALHLLYQDKGMSTDIKASVTSKDGNCIYTYGTTTVTFNMANNILESITVSGMSEKLDGTYKPVNPEPDPEPEPEPINYKVIEGANSTWVIEDGENPVFRSNADFSKFVRVELDGKVLDPANYTAKSGSTIITLKPEYAAKLAPGKHTINIVSTDGSAATVFYIDEAIANTDGFTLSEATMSSAFIAGSIIALTGVFFELKKKKVR